VLAPGRSANAEQDCLADRSTGYCRDDVDAESNADDAAAGAVDLASHGRAEELHEHGKRVQAEFQAALWRRQVGGMVGLRPGTSNCGLVGICSAHEIDSHADLASVLVFSFLVDADHVHPERVFLLVELPLFSLLEVRSNLVLVVGLSESDGLLGERTVLKQLSEVNLGTSDDVVTLEEISIKHLHRKIIGANGLFVKEEVFGIDEAVVPTRLLTWL